MPKALFVTYGGGHVTMVLPVIARLQRARPDIECRLLALTTAQGRARAAGVASLGYRDLLHLTDAGAALRWGAQLASGNSSPDVPAEETSAYLGVNYLDLVAQHGEEGARLRYERHGRYGFYPIHFMRRVLEHLAPDVVVATNSPRSERAALDTAIERGLPCVGMVDLFGQDDDTYLARRAHPSFTCVLSPAVRGRLLARGFSPSGVVVTGNPAFDGLFAQDTAAAAQRYLAQRGWQGLRPILWAGHSEGQAHPATPVPAGPALALEVEGLLRGLVRDDPSLALVVRYHPGQWHHFSPEPPQERVHFSVPPREPIHPVILASSLVVVQNSTVGLESAVAGKPVLSIENAPSVHIGFSLAKMGVSTACPTPRDLLKLVPSMLEGSAQAPTGYASDGKAAERVAAVVVQALQGTAAGFQSKSDDVLE